MINPQKNKNNITKKNLSKIIKTQKGFLNTQNLKMMGNEFKEVFANKKY